MSYDLYFTPASGSTATPQDVAAFLASRPSYTVANGQALYENKRTGVYFIVEFDELDRDESVPGAVALALINYCRPRFFIQEAEEELSALVTALGLSVNDPQGGMPDGVYSPEELVAEWDHGNRRAYEAIPSDERLPVDTSTLERVWSWNRRLPEIEAVVLPEHDVFVPGIMLVKIAGQVRTVSVWPDGIPLVVPEVDYLLIGRSRMARKTLFGAKPDKGLIPAADAATLFEQHRQERTDDLFVLDYDQPPADVEAFVRGLKLHTSFEMVAMDAVMDQ